VLLFWCFACSICSALLHKKREEYYLISCRTYKGLANKPFTARPTLLDFVTARLTLLSQAISWVVFTSWLSSSFIIGGLLEREREIREHGTLCTGQQRYLQPPEQNVHRHHHPGEKDITQGFVNEILKEQVK
jgi:hypothetical protein